MFEEEIKAFKAELQLTQKHLTVLEDQLAKLPDTTDVKQALARLKNPQVESKKSTSAPKQRAAQDGDSKGTRRKKSEMLAFRAQIKSVCQLLLKRKDTFSTKQVLNALVGQGIDASNANAQIVRGTLKSFVKQGWLEQSSASTWTVVRD